MNDAHHGHGHAHGHAHAHAHACDCAAHRHADRARERPPEALGDKAPLWTAALPVIACAFCPVCLSTYAKVLSIAGVGIGLSEEHHRALLAIAVTISVGASAHRAWMSRRTWPLLVAILGAALVIAGHALGEASALEWCGMVVLLGGALGERYLRRRAPARVAIPAEVAEP